jgi:hypothetical protein
MGRKDAERLLCSHLVSTFILNTPDSAHGTAGTGSEERRGRLSQTGISRTGRRRRLEEEEEADRKGGKPIKA